ncbi:MAG: hypothetical protein HFJ91_05395 [Muribaculaceae bacterium]|nr:hypothetical protein [Muribaculaceae bacterium]
MTKTPVWMTAVIIAVSLPLFSFPWLLDHPAIDGEGTVETLVWLYPFYMLLSGWLAWKSYPQRHYVSWMLLAVMVLSTLGIFSLVLL